MPLVDEALKAAIYEIMHSQGRMEGDLASLRELIVRMVKDHSALEERMSKTEKQQYFHTGIGTSGGMVLGALLHWLWR